MVQRAPPKIEILPQEIENIVVSLLRLHTGVFADLLSARIDTILDDTVGQGRLISAFSSSHLYRFLE